MLRATTPAIPNTTCSTGTTLPNCDSTGSRSTVLGRLGTETTKYPVSLVQRRSMSSSSHRLMCLDTVVTNYLNNYLYPPIPCGSQLRISESWRLRTRYSIARQSKHATRTRTKTELPWRFHGTFSHPEMMHCGTQDFQGTIRTVYPGIATKEPSTPTKWTNLDTRL